MCALSFCSFKHWIYNCEINLSNHTFAAFVRSFVRSLLLSHTLVYISTYEQTHTQATLQCVPPVCLPVFLSWLWLAIFYFFTLYFCLLSFFLCVFATTATAAAAVAAAVATVVNTSTIQNLARTRTQQQCESKSQLNKHKFKVIWRHLDGDDGGGGSRSSSGGGGCDCDAADVVHLLFSYCFSSFLTISVCSNSFWWFEMPYSPTARALSLAAKCTVMSSFRLSLAHIIITHWLTQLLFLCVFCFSSLLYLVDFSAFVFVSRFFRSLLRLDFSSFFLDAIQISPLVGTVGDLVLLNLNETHSVCSLPVWNRAERTHMAIAHEKLCECLVARSHCILGGFGDVARGTLNAMCVAHETHTHTHNPFAKVLAKWTENCGCICKASFSLLIFISVYPSHSDLESMP